MLGFRSEAHVVAWCKARELPLGPLVSLEQQWELARTWYANRLTMASRRPQPDEMVEILASIGLEGPFWDPGRDSFGRET